MINLKETAMNVILNQDGFKDDATTTIFQTDIEPNKQTQYIPLGFWGKDVGNTSFIKMMR